MSASEPQPRLTADTAAIGLSGLCLLHCIAVAVAAVAPGIAAMVLEGAVEHTLLHAAFLILAVPLALWALTRNQPKAGLLAIGIVGLLMLGAGVLHLGGEAAEIPFSMAGATLLVVAHWLNWKRQHPRSVEITGS